MPTESARLASHNAAARQATPAPVTRRGPKRSASMPPGAPARNQMKPATENTSATCAREAPNSAWKALKKAPKEYAAPKPTNMKVKAAATTSHPWRSAFLKKSVNRAACRDRPERFDDALAHADIPVIEVDGWVAVPWDQHQLVAKGEFLARCNRNPAVLVGGLGVGEARALPDARHPRIDARGLE